MDIKVCGPGCASCEKTLKIVEAAIAARGVTAGVDGQVKCIGRVPRQQEVEQWLG